MGKRIEGARPTVGLSTWRAHCLQGELGGRGEGRKQEKRYERAKTKSQGREVAHTKLIESTDSRVFDGADLIPVITTTSSAEPEAALTHITFLPRKTLQRLLMLQMITHTFSPIPLS